MAIEGPLRELGVHDLFQLLDLGRKSGRLRITSTLRGNEGYVDFQAGRVVDAAIRDNPHKLGQMLLRSGRISEADLRRATAIQRRAEPPRRLGDVLVAVGAVSAREVERQLHRQIEAVVFELMSWSEGFFTFEEGRGGESADLESFRGLSPESLLMEAARRIDEWTRIADLIPGPHVVPALADPESDHPSMLDLRPNEWLVLSAIDGNSDLSAIAITAGVSEFDAARIVYGFMSTGLACLTEPDRKDAVPADDVLLQLGEARDALRDRRYEDALAAAERAVARAPGMAEAHSLAAEALAALNRVAEADSAWRRALDLDGTNARWLMSAARVAIRRGDLARAGDCWRSVIRLEPQSPDARLAQEGLRHADHLTAFAGAGHDQ